jgi:hypothetical protein
MLNILAIQEAEGGSQFETSLGKYLEKSCLENTQWKRADGVAYVVGHPPGHLEALGSNPSVAKEDLVWQFKLYYFILLNIY